MHNASGTRITTATNTITLAIKANPDSGVVLGTTTASAVNGVATFSGLKIEKSGAGYTRVALTLDALSTTSPQFTISVGTSSKLAFTVQPSNDVTNTAIAPAVEVDVQDSVGNTVTTAVPTVNLIIGNNPQARIWWEPRQRPQQTRALRSQPCHSTGPGSGFTLIASAHGLTDTFSAPFDIVVPPTLTPTPVPSVSSWTLIALFMGLIGLLLARMRRMRVLQ